MPRNIIAPRRAAVALGLALGVVALFAASSCGNSSHAAGLAAGCSVNSDCDGSLTCVFGRCHAECRTSKDCSGETCLPPGACELTQESSCSASLPCVAGLVCADDICRAACSPNTSNGTTGGCLDQQACVAVKSSAEFVCIDSAGEAGTGAGGSGAGGSGAGGSGAGGSGAGGSGAGGSTSTEGAGGSEDAGADSSVASTSCPSAQTQFGNVALGDSSPYFQSGVGARSANDLYIFNGYVGPDPAGGGGSRVFNAVYVQAFDPKTGLSKGSARPLFTITSTIPLGVNASGWGLRVVLYSSAIAPTGQIALVFAADFADGGNNDNVDLYAAFLDSADTASDGGAAGLALRKLVHLAPGWPGWPYAIWSEANQAFVISWRSTQSPYFVQVDKFLVGGQSAGGGTDVVPTNAPSGAIYSRDNSTNSGSVGQSGGRSGVAYLDTNRVPALTVLDSNGSQVGRSVDVVPASPTGAWVAVGGTSKGFVYLYDEPPTSIGGVFVPASGSAGVIDGYTDGGFTDGKDASEFSTFTFTGAVPATFAIAVPDDAGGAGGIGVAIQRSTGVSFAYVNADGMGHQGPNSVFGHTAVSGDLYSMTNFAGSFVVSLYSAGTRSTQAVASGCQ